ncbi:MAG: glycerophosphodiester phosphodiesterase family protein [Gammaproteobacteria bacterium]|nr:glycerophosphodiester phosphodiesterase family protein [Gammaproteobacteria bacterium]MDH5592826.1 glycerophosphodiester phosphodiesterase family protein [Gammaproteobacteria bacterium]MDH5613957.1 glycerophosphodiester phosphodiesterase family protein [Gammaproteobacteria bacterium]
MEIPFLIAHRGYASCYPENSLSAVTAALQAGSCYIEIDLQMTSDGIPVLLHDEDLQRTTGRSGKVHELSLSLLSNFHASESDRFGDKFGSEPVPTLFQFVDLMKQWPSVTAFIELKEESLAHFGAYMMVDAVMKIIEPIKDRIVLISFDDAALRYTHINHSVPIGWVIREWNKQSMQCAQSLMPGYLFCNYKKLPDETKPMWSGDWQWCLYEVTDPELALELAGKGASMIETMAVGDMLRHPELAKRNCLD